MSLLQSLNTMVFGRAAVGFESVHDFEGRPELVRGSVRFRPKHTVEKPHAKFAFEARTIDDAKAVRHLLHRAIDGTYHHAHEMSWSFIDRRVIDAAGLDKNGRHFLLDRLFNDALVESGFGHELPGRAVEVDFQRDIYDRDALITIRVIPRSILGMYTASFPFYDSARGNVFEPFHDMVRLPWDPQWQSANYYATLYREMSRELRVGNPQ